MEEDAKSLQRLLATMEEDEKRLQRILATMEEDVKRLQRILASVRHTLNFFEMEDEGANRLYLADLWRILYDAEDALRDYEDRKSGHGEPPTGGCAPCGEWEEPSSLCRSLLCSSWTCIGENIKRIIKDYHEISADWSLWKDNFLISRFQGSLFNPRPKRQVRQETGWIPSQEEIYSFKEDIDYIVDLVCSRSTCMKCLDSSYGDAGEKKLIIFPVIGAPGTGKTTLVQHVYNDKRITKDYFEKKFWVCCVGKEDDALQLLNSVLGAESVGDSGQTSVAQERIETQLKDQRILLVLDDACATNSDFWETFWSTIANPVLEGSVAMVIAQKYQVLEAMPSYLPRIESYNVFPLTFDDCWSIFKSTFSSSNGHAWEDEDNEFTKIGKQIVKKYEGFPGIIKHAARQLSNSSDIDDWEGHLNTNSFGSYYSISFRQLSFRAKRCLGYCCLFPEDYLFGRDYMIRLWTAEEFVDEGKYGERGADCFKELLHNFFLLHRGDKYEIPSVVLDILRDSDFFTRIDSKNTGQSSSSQGRHISSTGRETEANLPQSTKALQHMRSFLTFGCKVPKNLDFFLPDMGHLRTLELSDSDIEILPDSIGSLRNLRFLGLNGTLIKALPDSVGKLQHLRFLCLNGTLTEALPDSICTLTNLLALELESCSNLCGLPKGLDKLTNLQTLPVFKVSEGNGQYSGLQELAELVNLKNELSILGLRFHHVSNQKPRSSYLEKMRFLKSLKLCWLSFPSDEPEYHYSHSRYCDANKESCVIDSLMLHANLQNLIIQSYGGSVLPKWIESQSFKKMRFINLKDCRNCQSLPSLGRLPKLKHLLINCPQVEKIDDQFCGGSNSFPSLKELVLIGMSKLEKWSGVGKYDFRVLQELECIGCPRLVQIPEFASLKKLKMDKCKKVAITPGFSSVWSLQICATICSELAELTSLVHLSLVHCQGPVHLSKLPQLNYLWVEDCEGLKLGDGIKLSYLDALFVANCLHDIVLPQEMKQPPYSHFQDDHTLCFERNYESSELILWHS